MRWNYSKLAAFGAATTLLISGALPQAASAQSSASCTFQLGFASLADSLGGLTGKCLENEYFNPLNGNAEQHTTNGLLYWRKMDGTTAFTDGYQTWLSGPYGLQVRLNAERYDWEAIDPPAAQPLGQPAQPAQPAPTAPATTSTTPVQQPVPEDWATIPNPCNNFRGANLTNADKRGFDFTCADLQQAKMSGGDFTEANFTSARLDYATLNKATLYHATLNKVSGDYARLSQANLRQAVIESARFFRADFQGADLRNAVLRNSDLSHSSLAGADLRCADLRGADLTAANLTGANVTGANMTGTLQDQVTMSGIIGLHSPVCS